MGEIWERIRDNGVCEGPETHSLFREDGELMSDKESIYKYKLKNRVKRKERKRREKK